MGLGVLVVEDDIDSHTLLIHILNKLGVEFIFSAHCGMSAIEIFKSNVDKIGLILMDVRLPDIDGLTVSEKILEIRKVNIIVQTASTLNNEKIKALSIGCVEYLRKPISIKYLESLLRKYFS